MPASQLIALIASGLKESLYMVVATSFFSYLIGLPLGAILFTSSDQGLRPNKLVYGILNFVVNVLRSVPFLILMVYVIPLTRFVAGTSIGSGAAVVPLTLSAAPFVGRLVESSLREVPQGVIDAARAMGAHDLHILFRVLLPEAKPSILSGSVIACVNILSYSAMAGFVGGGGLGAIAINYGYNRYDTNVMTWTVIVIVILVQAIELLGKKVIQRYTRA